MFLIFGYNEYYPSGGINDLVAISRTKESAKTYGLGLDWEYIEIYDVETGEVYELNGADWVMSVLDVINPNLNDRVIATGCAPTPQPAAYTYQDIKELRDAITQDLRGDVGLECGGISEWYLSEHDQAKVENDLQACMAAGLKASDVRRDVR